MGTPGKDRRYWRVCWAKVAPGQWRCGACLRALIAASDASVRRHLAAEKGLPADAVSALRSDPDPMVTMLLNQHYPAADTSAFDAIR